jgi:hypothetical protein
MCTRHTTDGQARNGVRLRRLRLNFEGKPGGRGSAGVPGVARTDFLGRRDPRASALPAVLES